MVLEDLPYSALQSDSEILELFLYHDLRLSIDIDGVDTARFSDFVQWN